jgi:hypothetical protein
MLAVLQPQQQLEQQLQRQQQQLEQLHRDLQQQQQQLGRLLEMTERELKQDQRQQQKPLCLADLRFVNSPDPRRVAASANAIVSLNFFSAVSKPADMCLPAEIRVTASYLDGSGNLVCTAIVENVAIQKALTQSVNLDIRPWNFREFVRWKNEPPQINSGFKLMMCMNPEGLAEATTAELEQIMSVRVRAIVLPLSGGMSTAEILLNLQR